VKMIKDFGSGMTIDELIGLCAWHIHALRLPPEPVFNSAGQAASVMIEAELESYILAELWGDGHSVWRHPKTNSPVVVTATGQIKRSSK